MKKLKLKINLIYRKCYMVWKKINLERRENITEKDIVLRVR